MQGLELGILTTAANVNEIANLEAVLDKVELPANTPLYGDKGYQSDKKNLLIKKKKRRNRILKKAKKNNPLTELELNCNKLVGQTRFKVERCFGSIKRWLNGGVARYRGLEKMHT